MLALFKTAVCAVKQRSMLPSLTSAFHILSNPRIVVRETRLESFYKPPTPYSNLLSPPIVRVMLECGLKVMGKVRRRCKDCFLVWREQRLYNLCKTHPRHKQMSMVKKLKNTWILSHATQGKVRPW